MNILPVLPKESRFVSPECQVARPRPARQPSRIPTRSRHERLVPLLVLGLASCAIAEPDACELDPCACEPIPDVAAQSLPTPEASFELWRDGAFEPYVLSQADGDTVQCRRLDCEQNVVTLTFADRDGDLRVELDVCGLSQRSYFLPLDPQVFPECEDEQRGVIARVIDRAGEVFTSDSASSPCRLLLTRQHSALTGSFECAPLRSASGVEVRLSTGNFECAVEPDLP